MVEGLDTLANVVEGGMKRREGQVRTWMADRESSLPEPRYSAALPAGKASMANPTQDGRLDWDTDEL